MKKQTKTKEVPNLDPENHRARLYKLNSVLLTRLEQGKNMIVREFVQGIMAVARIEQLLLVMQEKERDHESERSGENVRKYASAFSPHAVGGGTGNGGSAAHRAEPEPADWFESAAGDDPD